MKGLLDVGDLRLWWPDALHALSATPLLLRPEHITAIHKLQPLHHDPFDRALIAQALTEDLTVATTDAMIPTYSVKCLQIRPQ